MSVWSTRIIRLLTDESGPTAVEYAALMLLLLLACLTAINILGQATAQGFAHSHDEIMRAMSAP